MKSVSKNLIGFFVLLYLASFCAPESIAASNDSWQPINLTGSPSARARATAVWTGSEMLVWGGQTNSGETNSGARYNPVTDTWAPISTIGAPSPRRHHRAVWTGSEMLVWGGVGPGSVILNTGGKYNPITDTWSPITIIGAPSARYVPATIWTGSEMIIWGGITISGYTNTGARYNPYTDTWNATSIIDAPNPEGIKQGIWSGTELLLWNGSGVHSKYNPSLDSWNLITLNGAPNGFLPSGVWNGQGMIVWGGSSSGVQVNTGGLYDVSSDSWTPTEIFGAPHARSGADAFWTGNNMLIWGGTYDSGGNTFALNSGGLYNPVINTWSSTSTVNAPLGEAEGVGVWTGSQMIVWGGISYGNGNDGALLNTGGRYAPPSTSFDLPFSYSGRPNSTNAQFKSAFWSRLTAGFDHVVASGTYRPFTGVTYKQKDCPNGALGIACYDGHNGTDFSRLGGDAVFSVGDGTVVFASDHTASDCSPNKGGYGCVVIAEYPGKNVYALFAHLKQINVSENETLDVNKQIGVMGNTGCGKCGVHLHLGVMRDVTPANVTSSPKKMTKSDWQELLYQVQPAAENPLAGKKSVCTYNAPNGKKFAFQDPTGWKGIDSDTWNFSTSSGGCGIDSPYLWKSEVGLSAS